MTEAADLQAFLDAQRVTGEVQSERQAFTLAREHALRKLAQFRDPFEHAWIVRAVQAGVALDPYCPIRVRLGQAGVHVGYEQRAIDLKQVEQSFCDPESRTEPALQHLSSALWSVASKVGWTFELRAQGSSKTLVWSNNDLRLQSLSEHSEVSGLLINRADSSSGGLGWVGRTMANSRFSLEVVDILAERCYPSPAPLVVDGRRLDSLLNCPGHGWGFFAVPIWIQALTQGRPKLALSPTSLALTPFQSPSTSAKNQSQLALCWEAQFAKELLPKLSLPSEAGLAFVLGVGKAPTYNVGSEQAPRGQYWRTTGQKSRLHWVLDGAVVCKEPLSTLDLGCSVAVFLSAEGLQTDLSGFALVESEAKRERIKSAVRQVAEQLSPEFMTQLFQELGAFHHRKETRRKNIARGIGGVGLGLVFLNPVLGLGAMAAGGILSLVKDDGEHSGRLDWLQEGLLSQKKELMMVLRDLG